MLITAPIAAPPADAPVVTSFLVALVISLVFWPVVAFASTAAHEGAHALTASMFGGTVSRITIKRGAVGKTNWKSSDAAAFVARLAGYLGPSVFGLAGALLLVRGHVTAVLWLSVVLLFAALVLAATWFTRLVIVTIGALIVFVLKTTGATQETFFAYTWVWFLLLAGFGHVIWHKSDAADYADLRKDTYVPVGIWYGLYWMLTLAGLVTGGAIMFGVVHVW